MIKTDFIIDLVSERIENLVRAPDTCPHWIKFGHQIHD